MKNNLKIGFLYYVSTVIVLSFVFIMYSSGISLYDSLNFGAWAYFITGSLSWAAVLALPAFLFPLVFNFVKSLRKVHAPVAILLSTVIVIFFIANGMVYSLYRFHINGFVIDMLFGGGAGDIFAFDIMLYVKVIIAVLMIVAGMVLLWFACRWLHNKYKYVAALPITIILVLSLLFSHLFHAYSAVVRNPGVIRAATVIPYNAPLTANRLMLKLGVISKETMVNNIGGGENDGIKYPLNPIVADSVHSSDTNRKNILLLVVDSWNKRAWTPEVFPNLWDLSLQSAVFDNHLSSGNGTTGSILGMFFGLPASYKDNLDISGTQPILVEHLLSTGYDVKAFASATLVHPPFGRMLFSKVPDLRVESKGETNYERDCDITKDFIKYINEKPEEPFFAFLFYDLAHGCELPKDRNTRFTPAWDYPDYLKLNNNINPEPYWNLYRNSLFNIDSLAGNVIAELEKNELLENTVVIVTGDHGEEFNENKKNYWGHGGNFSPVQVRVPFFVYDAQKKDTTVYRHRTTHYDVSTTLLKEYLGVTNPVGDLGIGYMLQDTCNRDWHLVGDYTNYAYIMDSDMRILEKKHSGYIEVYDSMMNVLDGYKFDAVGLNKKIMDMNRFYE